MNAAFGLRFLPADFFAVFFAICSPYETGSPALQTLGTLCTTLPGGKSTRARRVITEGNARTALQCTDARAAAGRCRPDPLAGARVPATTGAVRPDRRLVWRRHRTSADGDARAGEGTGRVAP